MKGKKMNKKIKEIIEEVLDVDPRLIDDKFGPEDSDLWDSLNNLRLITAIEEEFDIQFTMEEIKSMVNFEVIVRVVKYHYTPTAKKKNNYNWE